MAQLREKESNNQKKLAAKDEEIRDLQKKISTQSLTLTQEARLNLNSDLERLRTERQRIYEDNQRDMNETAARLFQKIQKDYPENFFHQGCIVSGTCIVDDEFVFHHIAGNGIPFSAVEFFIGSEQFQRQRSVVGCFTQEHGDFTAVMDGNFGYQCGGPDVESPVIRYGNFNFTLNSVGFEYPPAEFSGRTDVSV